MHRAGGVPTRDAPTPVRDEYKKDKKDSAYSVKIALGSLEVAITRARTLIETTVP